MKRNIQSDITANIRGQKVQKIQELRRSSAAQPVKNKKVYDRTQKHKGVNDH